jgi:hypothetical protein
MSLHQIFREVTARAVFEDVVLIHTLSKTWQKLKFTYLILVLNI